LVIP